MNIVIAPGNSECNRDWANNLSQKLSDVIATSIQTLEYGHWGRDTAIDLDIETDRLKDLVGKETIVIGKSAGAILALKACTKKEVAPTRCIFIGMAIHWAQRQDYPINEWIQNYAVPTLYIQNEHDPAISVEDSENLLRSCGQQNYSLKILPGNSHEYDDFDLLAQLIFDQIAVSAKGG